MLQPDLERLPTSDELPDSDDTPVDNEEQNFVPNVLLFLLEYIMETAAGLVLCRRYGDLSHHRSQSQSPCDSRCFFEFGGGTAQGRQGPQKLCDVGRSKYPTDSDPGGGVANAGGENMRKRWRFRPG